MVKEKLDEPGVDFHIDLISLRTDFDVKTIFWNLIYYFNEYHLPYEFILPYEDTEFVTEFKEYKKEVKKSLRVYKPDPNKLKSSKSRKAPTIVSQQTSPDTAKSPNTGMSLKSMDLTSSRNEMDNTFDTLTNQTSVTSSVQI